MFMLVIFVLFFGRAGYTGRLLIINLNLSSEILVVHTARFWYESIACTHLYVWIKFGDLVMA